MMSLHFCHHDVIDFDTASTADIPLFNKFFHHMLKNGIYLPPSGYESWFLSNALSYEDLNNTIEAAKKFSFQISKK
jgi:glutamate-1-semialdehyde 2,1-aminomutase